MGQTLRPRSCLNHLFTHVDAGAGVLGTAVTPGICATGISGGRVPSISNAAFTTTFSRSRTIAHWQTVAVVAHEVALALYCAMGVQSTLCT